MSMALRPDNGGAWEGQAACDEVIEGCMHAWAAWMCIKKRGVASDQTCCAHGVSGSPCSISVASTMLASYRARSPRADQEGF